MYSSQSRTTEQGFSLIELLIVVFIIGVVAAIAVPNLVNSKQAAHGASAICSLRVIHSAETAYRAAHSQFGSLSALASSGYLTDPQLVTGQHSHYDFVINSATLSASVFEVTATPSVAPWRYYYINASGVIRSEYGSAASAASEPIN
ncbi:MAG: competence type IV pilus major pilin ComGC [Pyrinomonadaceae bacterium]|nr:prepilin-type N-terminal cleavage/methylation domain-containing protein [Pyrinomonadaceae bacterium]